MAAFTLSGPVIVKMRTLLRLVGASVTVGYRRAVGRTAVRDWPWDIEAATLFWRMHMNFAFSLRDMAEVAGCSSKSRISQADFSIKHDESCLFYRCWIAKCFEYILFNGSIVSPRT